MAPPRAQRGEFLSEERITEGLAAKDRMRRLYSEWFNEEHGDCECWVYHRKPRCSYRMCKDNPHLNFYCPLCGEVTCGMKRQGEWIVIPHYKEDKEALLKGFRSHFGKPCRGGPEDGKADRAP